MRQEGHSGGKSSASRSGGVNLAFASSGFLWGKKIHFLVKVTGTCLLGVPGPPGSGPAGTGWTTAP